MKTTFYLLLLFLLFLTIKIQAQTIESLDKKKGFNDFTIGDTYEKWRYQLQFESSDYNSKTYSYIPALPDLFNKYPIHLVLLKFNNDKLIELNIILKKWEANNTSVNMESNMKNTIENFTDIGLRFNTLFGKPTKTISPKSKPNEGDVLWETSAIWAARNISLIELYNFFQFQNVAAVSVKILDNNFAVKSYTEGF